MEKIDIKIIEIPGENAKNIKKCYIELHDHKLVYCHDYDVEQIIVINDGEPEHIQYRAADKDIYKKESLVGASLSSEYMIGEDSKKQVYSVIIPISGTNISIVVYFEKISEANSFLTKITDYIIS